MRPTLGRIILVTTPGQTFAGQEEHAAIVVKVIDEKRINATLFTGGGSQLFREHVPLVDTVTAEFAAKEPTWRWPPRE